MVSTCQRSTAHVPQCRAAKIQKVFTMPIKTLLALTVGSLLLLGCADANHYPITGKTVGANDQVRYMVSPNLDLQ